ncbi:MAG: hypothetical protein LBR89_00710 [Holosporales bacterium]|nr:hypothetical protein [Holosporales bacterium]
MKWVIVGMLMSLSTNLSASVDYLRPHIERFDSLRYSKYTNPMSCPNYLTELSLLFECPVVCGDNAVQQLPPETKAQLDKFLCRELPDGDVRPLANGILRAIRENGQLWFGVERYMCERLIKNGFNFDWVAGNYGEDYRRHYGYDGVTINPVTILRHHVEFCAHEWLESELSEFAPLVVQCVRDQTTLPPDRAEEMAIKLYQVNGFWRYSAANIEWRINRIYANAIGQELRTLDHETRRKCKNCAEQIAEQICNLCKSISDNDPLRLQVFIPYRAHRDVALAMPGQCQYIDLQPDINAASTAARHDLWSCFVAEVCPQIQTLSNVPSTWPCEWTTTWCQAFDSALRGFGAIEVPQDATQHAPQPWWSAIKDVLPITCPPNAQIRGLMRDIPLTFGKGQRLSIINKAWLQAWQDTCARYCSEG